MGTDYCDESIELAQRVCRNEDLEVQLVVRPAILYLGITFDF